MAQPKTKKDTGKENIVLAFMNLHRFNATIFPTSKELRKLKRGLYINNAGDEEEDGREFQKGEDICIPTTDSC